MPDTGECYFSFYQAVMFGLMHVVLRSLGFTETSLCRVSSCVSLDDSGVKSVTVVLNMLVTLFV